MTQTLRVVEAVLRPNVQMQAANREIFPNATNLSSVDHLLPDVRQYLLSFDYNAALTSITTSESSPGFLNVLEAGSYRQFGWSTTAYFILAAAFFAFVFVAHVMWVLCLFKCGCRQRNPLAKPKIYSKLQKVVWATLMLLFFFMSAAAAVMTFFVVHNDIKPLAASAFKLLNETLRLNLTTFESNFLTPMDELLANGYRGEDSDALFLANIQEHSRTDLEVHTFIDKQSYANDVIGQPVFNLLDPLTSYSTLYPAVNNDSIDCELMNITQPSVVSRMSIGGKTGCFKCKTCLGIVELIAQAKTSWRKHIFEVQIDMLTSKGQLKDFSLSGSTLTSAIQDFVDRIHRMCADFREANDRIASRYDAIAKELQLASVFGLYGLIGLCGLSIILAPSAFAHGMLTGRRKLGRRLDKNPYAFVPSTQSAEDVSRLLFDQNFVEATKVAKTLEFSDTLRVPPHPTPTTDTPDRFDFDTLYDMPALFSLESLTANTDEALVELFAWNEGFVTNKYDTLKALAFVNDEVATPYNETLHQDLLNSTIQQLMDPDNDGEVVTASDLLEIQTVFNESWRGLDDEGLSINEEIPRQWLVVAQLYYQKQKLETYATTVSGFITKIHPLLGTFVLDTCWSRRANYAPRPKQTI
ncbi:unnamed protein product [Phytophthora lilii]|uniref:Unnamed protein product n=1 Tax=Phytophthora lilii TaxID=2077276 RepID=A0A9W6WPW0_9STRA|nr:unnamed protein product [Phytophthora lilii]